MPACRWRSTVTFAAALCAAASLRAQPPRVEDTIDVIGTTPLGSELDARKIAANVQSATAEQIRNEGALDLSDFMRRSLGSVFVNDAQSNPLQPDVQYRGFVGSPLLGLPQGLAVYQDGVRLNEPFGDTVNWALIPESAIERIDLLPGSNPLFGLNALGGALAIKTKDGATNPGTRVDAFAGSFGRMSAEVETGGTIGNGLDYFVTASRLQEDGWRDYSPTEANQLFAKLGMSTETSTVNVSFTYADTDLIGNGAAPAELLEIDRNAIFTHPDRTTNHYGMLNVVGTQRLSSALTLAGNLYVRSSDVQTYNGDDSDFAECENDPGFICLTEGGAEVLALDENGEPIQANDELEGATINRTRTDQHGAGFGLQATWNTSHRGHDNRFLIGLARDVSGVDFASSTELGMLDATRLAIPGGVLVGDSLVALNASTTNTGVYLSDTLSLGDTVALTLSGRYNRTEVELTDLGGGELTGDHTFERFNPAVGLTVGLGAGGTFYTSYGEANRAPSPVELTCADQDAPCRLPNAFVSDPPLEQVVARTFEAGVRGRFKDGGWNAGVFRTDNDDDILFISAGRLTNQGFFDNVGKTRREGVELNVDGEVGERVSWFANLSVIKATFREQFVVQSPNNPAAVDGEITVEPGDRLPLIPDRLFKAGVRWALGSSWHVGGDVLSSAGQHFRGDEGNDVGQTDGYTVVNLRAEYRFSPGFVDEGTFYLNVDNVLDEEYTTFGTFGDAQGVLGANFADTRFVGPGAPRGMWVGVRFAF